MKSVYSNRSLRSAPFISALLAVALAASPALGQGAEGDGASTAAERAAARSQADTEARARALLETLASATSAEERLAAAKALAALRPTPVAFLESHFARERGSTDADRRAVLAAIEAEVPDEQGRFRTPGRSTKRAERAADEFDWLAELAKLSPRPGLADTLTDVATLRALAASTDPEAGDAILRFVFGDAGLIYRDEGGRYLRKMSPYSLPALIRGSQSRKNRSMARYANYQLERLDRQNPFKAFADAPTDDLEIAVLEAFAESQYREAVYTVLDQVDHATPRVRAAARAAWLEYMTGKPPREAPKRKLELPGGKLTEEEEPLWLDHRELGEIALRRRLEELTGTKPERKATPAEMSEELFAFYDQRRTREVDAELAAGLARADDGDLEGAVALFDRILVQEPDYAKRDQMAPVYLRHAEARADAGAWREAAIAYGKAHSVAPEGEHAKEALSQHHYARGKATQAEGGDGSAEFARAEELGGPTAAASDGRWLLLAGVAGLGTSLVLLFLGIARRRAMAA